jgi:hypothetical protein
VKPETRPGQGGGPTGAAVGGHSRYVQRGSSQQITADPPPLSGRFWCRGEILSPLSPEAVVFRWLLASAE